MAPVDGDNVSICDDISSMRRFINWSWNFAISEAANLSSAMFAVTEKGRERDGKIKININLCVCLE